MPARLALKKRKAASPVCYETGGLKRAMFGISGHRFLRFWFWYERMRWLGRQRCSQASTRHVQHTFQVVDHSRQADLGLRSFLSAQQEAWMAEDVVLQRGKGMLHR